MRPPGQLPILRFSLPRSACRSRSRGRCPRYAPPPRDPPSFIHIRVDHRRQSARLMEKANTRVAHERLAARVLRATTAVVATGAQRRRQQEDLSWCRWFWSPLFANGGSGGRRNTPGSGLAGMGPLTPITQVLECPVKLLCDAYLLCAKKLTFWTLLHCIKTRRLLSGCIDSRCQFHPYFT